MHKSVLSEFDSYLATIPPPIKFDMIYFDGNHSKATIAYFEKLLPTITNDSVWILMIFIGPLTWKKLGTSLKSILWSQLPSMFSMGIVFFREQPKEHFIIRV
jgi:hypothetical protein